MKTHCIAFLLIGLVMTSCDQHEYFIAPSASTPLGFGAGGEGSGILFSHSTDPIEILVIQNIFYQEPPYPAGVKPGSKPTIRFYNAVSEIEKLVQRR